MARRSWHTSPTPTCGAIATDLTDGRFYYARVASVTDAGVQPVYSLRVDTEDHAFITNGFVSHNTEARLTPLAMEMLREIDEETVDFIPNYDGRVQEPTVLPSRFPNLLANGSGGIAVGMATNIPPHNLRELADAVFWCLDNLRRRRRGDAGRRHGAGQRARLPHLRADRRLARHRAMPTRPAAARSGCAEWLRWKKIRAAARRW